MYRITASCLLLAMAACSAPTPEPLADRAAARAAEAAISEASGGKVELDAARGTLTVEDGETHMRGSAGPEGMALPEWWPADVDLPQAHVIGQVVTRGPERLLVVTVHRPGQAVLQEIAQGMRDQGWTTASSSQSANGAGMGDYRKSGREVTAMVIPARKAGDATAITYRLRQARAQ